MSRREQIITAILGAAVLVFGVVLYVNQNTGNDDNTKVLGVQVSRSTTTAKSNADLTVPGFETTTTTEAPVADATSDVDPYADTSQDADFSSPDDTFSNGGSTGGSAQQTTTVTRVVPANIPAPTPGNVSLTSDNTANISFSGGEPTVTSGLVLTNGALTTFTVGISESSNNVFVFTVTLFNQSSGTLNLNGTINLNITDNNGKKTVVPVSLGANSSVGSYVQLTASVSIALQATGSYSVNATTAGIWQ